MSTLIGSAATHAVEPGAQPTTSQPNNPILASQLKTDKQSQLDKKVIKIQKLIQQAIRNGSIESVLKNSDLDPKTKSTLRRLTPQDLKTLGSIKAQFEGMDPRRSRVGLAIY